MAFVLDCGSLPVLRPEDSEHLSCPVLSKIRHIAGTKGVESIIEWPLRTAAGEQVDLSNCFPGEASLSGQADYGVLVRFAGCDGCGTVYSREGAVTSVADGKVAVAVPREIYDYAGIYTANFAIVRAENNTPVFTDRGLLSQELSLFGDLTSRGGPLTLGDIRLHLRDTVPENDLWDDVEFDTAEILQAINKPVQRWNEEPPDIVRYNCRSFPFRRNWLNGVIAELMETGGLWYMRNHINTNHGGLSGDHKNRWREYLQVAGNMQAEYQRWLVQKKMSMNAEQGFGIAGSEYDGYR